MKKSELKRAIHEIIQESIGGFHQDLQSQIRGMVHGAKRSDYAKGDNLFTITGSPITFISDLMPDRKGNRRAMVRFTDGSTSSITLNNILPEMPSAEQFLTFIASKYSRYEDFVNAAMKRGYDENDGLSEYWKNRKK